MCVTSNKGVNYEKFIEHFQVPLGFEISGFDRSRTWVSQNGVFAFGFLESCSKEDEVDSFVVGIRYNLGDNEAVNVPVWSVGGGLRVSMNSTIRLSMDGRLILLDNPSGVIVWSSDTSSLAQLALSFLVSLCIFLKPKSPSKKSTSSYYSFVIRHSGELALVWENNVTYWSNHVNLVGSVKEAIFDGNGLLGLIDTSNKTVWSISSKDFDEPSLTLRRLKMDSDGNLRIYSWNHVLHEWNVGWQAVENQCDVFGSCGLYSLCGLNSSGAVCDCLYQDSVNWGTGLSTVDSGSSGCKKMVDLGNCKMNTSMMVMRQTFLYGLYPPQDVDIMLSEKACKEYCSNDTTCIAATSKNDVCLVPQAVSARGANPHVTAKPIPTTRGGDGKNFTAAIALIVLVTASGFVAIEMELWGGCLCDSGMAQRTEIKHFNMGVLGVVAKRLDAFVGLPFWPYIKLLFCMWLVLPVFSGASYIYMNFVRKYVKFGGTVDGGYPEERKKVLQMLSLDARIAVNQYADKNGWECCGKSYQSYSIGPPEPEVEVETKGEKFDWNESEWKVFDDTCPHRLAPLSEGRIDQWGRLQCVYHGWCFNGSGDCKLIPQAPPDGPPVHTFKKACVAAYPSTLHHDIVWFWPNTDPQYKDIILKKQPPFIPELEDPSYTRTMGNRDIAYGYDVLVENLMDLLMFPMHTMES
ncbi:hypothetical protein NC652_000120 [Populus alba x Populus x berolinensis]|nr:hypothetical protein NC652_000120 [Populus alba x Populus x berolinensis]